MKFHYMGKFDGNYDALPTREHEPDYVPFKEPSAKKLPLIINAIALVIAIVLIIPVMVVSGEYIGGFIDSHGFLMFFAFWLAICLLTLVVILPHEFLHGLCFKGDVYMYTNLSKGLCFVVGPELFSKSRFVLMSLLPNIVFGLIPYVIWIIFPNLWYLGFWGAIGMSMGGGDYMNALNALVQMPKGAKTYLHGMNSFWVKPE